MQDAPHPHQLLEAVVRYLRDEALPALTRHGEGALAYQARVAANMLDIARRELLAAPADEPAERARLQALVGTATAPPTSEARRVRKDWRSRW